MEIIITKLITYLVRKCFQSGVKTTKTQSFPEAEIGIDHDLLMMTSELGLRNKAIKISLCLT